MQLRDGHGAGFGHDGWEAELAGAGGEAFEARAVHRLAPPNLDLRWDLRLDGARQQECGALLPQLLLPLLQLPLLKGAAAATAHGDPSRGRGGRGA